uniref:Uncharacterized protein n=1 Tax=Ananas comosus var. bracteatus TaxID=296719 RepID=A0A6V7QGY9_ANACO|nr:unnamed protein product [Ananas comosus var. bracteatus]
MAVDLESFSIREFAAKMRNLDLGELALRRRGERGSRSSSSAPDLRSEVRWWSDELDAARSREAAAARADVDGSDRLGEEPAVETLAEKPLLDGEEEEERPMRASWRSKQRAPKKKRSIAEIFALSPLIEGVEEESDGCDGDDVGGERERDAEGGGGGVGRDLGTETRERDDEEASRKGKESAKDEERIENSSRKIEKKRANKKKSKINKNLKMGISVSEKHDLQLKVQEGKLVHLHKRKPGKIRSLPKKQKLNYTRNAKLKLKNLEEVVRTLPVRRRLKKQTQSASMKKTKGTKICSESAKSVSSSGVDGSKDGKTCRSFELPQLKSLCDIFYGALAASSAEDTSQKGSKGFTGSLESQVKNIRDKDAVSKSVGRKDGAFSDKKYADSLLSIDSQSDFLGTEGNLLTEPVDLNQKYAGEPSALNPVRELNLNSDSEMSLLGETRLQITSDAAKEPPVSIENCVPNSDTVSSLSLLGDWSSALLTSHPQRGMEATKLDSCNSKRFGNLRTPLDQCFPSRDRRIHEEFNGLPLRFSGELIQLASSSGSAYNESLKKQMLYPVYSTILSNHVELMNDQPKMKGNISSASLEEIGRPNKLLEQLSAAAETATSELGFTGFRNFGKSEARNHESNNKIWLSQSHSYQSEVSGCRCSETSRTQNCINGEKSICEFQPPMGQTMRLMGQNVTVGRQSKEHEASIEGKVWTDKEIILESRPSVRPSDISSPNGWPEGGPIHSVALSEADGLLKQSFFRPVEAPPSFYRMAASGTTFRQVQLKHQDESILKSGNSSEIGNYGYNTNLCSHSFSPHGSNFGYLNGGMGNSSSTHYKHSRSVCCSTRSFNPPIPNHDYTSFARDSTAHSPACLPHWLLNAIQQREMQEPSCLCNDAAGLQGPCTIPGSKFFRLPVHFVLP